MHITCMKELCLHQFVKGRFFYMSILDLQRHEIPSTCVSSSGEKMSTSSGVTSVSLDSGHQLMAEAQHQL